MNSIDKLISNLNKEQKDAVLSTEGPNLIVAGAGSGKTRVLTTRLIYIINQKKAFPNQILCVTFTNKAEKEMQSRVKEHIKGSSNAIPWLGTFHSISVKFLRRHAEALGYKSNFTILDTDDQKKLIRNIVKGEDLDAKKFSPQLILYHIDQWKNKGLLPKDVKPEKSGSIIKSIKTKKIAESIILPFVLKLNIDIKSLEQILKTSQLKPIAKGTSKTLSPRISPYKYVPNRRLV